MKNTANAKPQGLPPGKALRAMRTHAGLTQVDLSSISTIDQSQISTMENDRRVLRLDKLAHFADICGYRLALVPEAPDEETLFLTSTLPARSRRRVPKEP